MAASIRNYFLEKDLRYVFSYTADLAMKIEEIGPVPGGARVNIFTEGGELFQVLNERSPWAENNVRGKLLPGGTDWAFLGEDGVGRVDVRAAFRTEDKAYIEMRARGVFLLGPGGFRELLRERDPAEDDFGTFEKPVVVPVNVAPTFETSHPRYQWLTKLQCVGFGRVQIVDARARQLTVDVYGLA